MLRKPVPVLFALLLSALVLAPGTLPASDHADPLIAPDLTPGLTGLFIFPDGDRLALVLGTHRALSVEGPYNLKPYEFAIHMDLHSEVTYDDAEDRARYGGTVVDPASISPDVTLSFRLDENANLVQQRFEGLLETNEIRVWAGVRDDPFIFPRFFGTNVIAIVVSVPRSAFPSNQRDWILWGATYEVDGGDQVDHVGRSNRTQLTRFDPLNTLPPSEHLAKIHDDAHFWQKAANFFDDLGTYGQPLENLINSMFSIRHYDYQPDVMVYTTRYAAGYPNGRRLTDDVVLLTCQIGECLLMEAAFTDTEEWPRQTVNDKEFLDEFPYLAEPWPAKEPAKKGFRWGLWITILLIILLILTLILAVIGLLCVI
ncbi:MAG TPA: DUF4331 family protein, partial [Thermoanaerobaculia bacterium]|nr:DUF4331 family protein [Thermoanaerobaculia bacterium]